MSEPIRLTFVSDTTDEFPENTNASFKVRLTERMTLKGEGWYVSLWKMTVPDHSQSSSVISSDMDLKVVKSTLKMLQFTNKNSKGKFQSVNLKTMTKSSTLKYIMSDDKPVSSGVQFWQNVMTDLHNTFIKQLQFEKNVKNDDLLLIPQEWFPSVKFDANGFMLEKVPSETTKDYSTFLIHKDIAKLFGFVDYDPTRQVYTDGVNTSFVTEEDSYLPSNLPWASSLDLGLFTFDHKVYRASKTPDTTTLTAASGSSPQMVALDGDYYKFSRYVTWHFTGLNESFDKLVGKTRHTVLLYSNVANPTIVGGDRYPLLREVTIERKSEGTATSEPVTREWIPLRGNELEIVEFELATPGGPLAVLPPGKTIVTIGLRQL